jgi:hypothetical protein
LNGEVPLFEEEQRFDQWWLRWPMIGLDLGCAGIFGWGLVQQLVFRQPWGDRPMSDAGLIVSSLFMVLVISFSTLLVLSMRLTVRVVRAGLQVRFFPFRSKTIPWNEISSWEACVYRPILEYGGWGMRYSFGHGWCYNVKGNRGVRLVLTSGRKLLIGSQKAEEMARAIGKMTAPGFLPKG